MWRFILTLSIVASSLVMAQPPVEEVDPIIKFPIGEPATLGSGTCDDGTHCSVYATSVCQRAKSRVTAAKIKADGSCEVKCSSGVAAKKVCTKPTNPYPDSIHDGPDPFGVSNTCEGIVCEQSQHGGIVSSCAELECAARCWCESCDPEGYCDIGQAFRCLQKC